MKNQLLLCALLAWASGSTASSGVPDASSIAYSSVAEAFTSLKGNPIAKVREQEGWTIFSVPGAKENSIWFFTPSNHPAHPAAVKHILYEEDGGIMMSTHALCEASKFECDKLMEQFSKLQQKIRESVQGGRDLPR